MLAPLRCDFDVDALSHCPFGSFDMERIFYQEIVRSHETLLDLVESHGRPPEEFSLIETQFSTQLLAGLCVVYLFEPFDEIQVDDV